MKEEIEFESFLFNDQSEGEYTRCDTEFMIERIVNLPYYRPFMVEKAVSLCGKIFKEWGLKTQLLEKSYICPILFYRLYKTSILGLDEILSFLQTQNCYLVYYYFWREIKDFVSFIQGKHRPYNLDIPIIENNDEIDQYINYGFLQSSIEYCLKYDDIESFSLYDWNKSSDAQWSPFEWSHKPKYLDFLSFSGFFGSIRCFKHLLLNGYEINDKATLSVMCSGSFELVHLCFEGNENLPECLFGAAEFGRIELLAFLIEQGAEINSKTKKLITPLHMSAKMGHISIVEYLIKNGADINSKNSDSIHF